MYIYILYIYECMYVYIHKYMHTCHINFLAISHRSKNTGFGLRFFLAVSNKRTFFRSMTCSSKTLKQI